MEIDIALHILELNKDYTQHELKKAYYKKCLQYHPDKNKDGVEMFKLCLEANELLAKKFDDDINSNESNNDDYNKTYADLFNEYVSLMTSKYKLPSNAFTNVLNKVLSSCKSASMKIIEELDSDKLDEIYTLLVKLQPIINIDNDILNSIEKLTSNEKHKTYTVDALIDDLFDHNVYKLVLDDKPYYIPLWHHQLYFKNNILVNVKPILPKNMEIDENNNITIYKKVNIRDALNDGIIDIEIHNFVLKIPVEKLLIKRLQHFVFKNKGIPRININKCFDDSTLSDVIVCIILE